jgi:hypothetical protein
MKYKVGQIFYLVGSETARVIPFRVVEEITRTTLEGIEKSFIAEMPDEEKTKVDVSKLKGATFENIKQVRVHMISNAKNAIDKMLSSAMKISEHVYGVIEENTSATVGTELNHEKDEALVSKASPYTKDIKEEDSVQTPLNDDIVKVDIGNGVMANMKVSDLDKMRV